MCSVPAAATPTFSSYKCFSYSLEDRRLGNHICTLLLGACTPASSLGRCKRVLKRKYMISILFCLASVFICWHNVGKSNTGYSQYFLLYLPGIQEIQSYRILSRICSSLQAAKIPAHNGAIQATKNALHQPREDAM